MLSILILLLGVLATVGASTYDVKVSSRTSKPVLSYIDGSSTYQQIFNPTYVQPSAGTNGKGGLLARTQNCESPVGAKCAFCGGSQDKASILTFSEVDPKTGTFNKVDESSVAFGPHDDMDSWGTEDPRMKYNPNDQLYYMFYTAYNGQSILLNLASSPNPTNSSLWTHHGAVFPDIQNSKSGALLLRDEAPHYLLWGDSSIRIVKSDNILSWPSDGGQILLSPREDSFDSRLVESGPPPLRLADGNYFFFYNSAQLGWPDDPNTSYNVGWVILDGKDPSIIIQRSAEPLLSPKFAWEQGVAPYSCNVPNVVFLEAAHPLPNENDGSGIDRFRVYFGGADNTIGSAVVEVSLLK